MHVHTWLLVTLLCSQDTQQIQILGLGNRPRIDVGSLVELFDPSDPLQQLMSTVTKVSRLVLDVDYCALTRAHVHSRIMHAKTLDSELGRWCRNLPHEWLPRVVYSMPGESLLTYLDIPTGSLWNFYRSARIILQILIQNMYDMVESLPGEFPEDDEVSEYFANDVSADATPSDVIRDLISDICKSIPFTLGDVDMTGNPPASNSSSSGRNNSRLRAIEGYELIWPLWGICTNSYSTPRQKRQARNALQRLGSVLGIKLASRLADAVELW